MILSSNLWTLVRCDDNVVQVTVSLLKATLLPAEYCTVAGWLIFTSPVGGFKIVADLLMSQ